VKPIQLLANLVSRRRAKWGFLVFWFIVLVALGSLAGKLNGVEKNDNSAWLPSGAQSTQVLNLWSKVQSPNVLPAVIVYSRPGGLTAPDKAKAQADATRFRGVAGAVASQIYGPFVSKDNRAIETTVSVNLGSGGWNNAGAADDALRTIAQSGADGLTVHIAGQVGYAADSENAFKGIDSTLLYAALAVVIVLLLLTYRSPVLWLLPVLSAGAALFVCEGLVYLLAAHAGLTVNAQTAGILDVLVFGVGTDYALLLTARYREELRRHEDRHEAMAVALRRAGPAIVASAGTVAISLLALSMAELNSTKDMGPVLAIGVVVALAAMTTLLPALLLICGRRVFWPVKVDYDAAHPASQGVWTAVGNRIARRPRVVWIATVVVLGVLAIGLTGLKASGLTSTSPPGSGRPSR
jgi:RND superfamily putative drug exporter